MKSSDFKKVVARRDGLSRLLNLSVQALFTQLAQSVACNQLHSIEQRCARWLLLTHDRVDSDEFYLTQKFLSQMLGVRRPSVKEVASRLQKQGLIRIRHRVIGDNQVPRALRKRVGQARSRVDAAGGRCVAASLKLPENERRVLVRVFDEEHAKSSFGHDADSLGSPDPLASKAVIAGSLFQEKRDIYCS